MKYRDLGVDAQLEIDMGAGWTRGVSFVDQEAKHAALKPGRSELDRIAIERGFLPRGSNLVLRSATSADSTGGDLASRPGTRTLHGSSLGFSDEVPRDLSDVVTWESDRMMRRLYPRDSLRYERLTDALHAPPGHPARWKHVLLVDVLGETVSVDSHACALRTNCHLHPDRGMSFYAYARGTRFHCFSCGAGGDQVEWAMVRHGLSRMDAVRLAAATD